MHTGCVFHSPFASFLLLLLFRVHNFTAFVVTAIGAHGMRQTHFTTVAALNQVAGL
jgi:hypothetical protein